jgi:glyoxylase-like metal-dependent hydrolase (beta-lactamase superfamily II)
MSGTSGLSYDVFVSGLAPVRGADLPNGDPPRWSPLAHTLVYGRQTALLVDPPITAAQTAALGDWIAGHGVELSYVYVTHWHGDHWLGAAQLLRRFPGATVLASAATLERIGAVTATEEDPAPWAGLFAGELPAGPLAFPAQAPPAGGWTLDGHEILSVEAGHSDTDDTTVLHVPSLGLVAAGDVVYNNVHQYLAETPGGGLEGWYAALDVVAGLRPTAVVAGHKDARRPDAPSDIDETRRYLETTSQLLDAGPTRRKFFSAVLDRYPERVNPYTVWLSALRLLPD